MTRREKIPRYQIGDELTVESLNKLVDAINRQALTGGAGVNIQSTSNGTMISVPARYVGYPAITTSSISARSGSTPGSGTVTLYLLDTSQALAATSTTGVTVYSYSSAAISSGKYCWVVQDPNGEWWVISVEC